MTASLFDQCIFSGFKLQFNWCTIFKLNLILDQQQYEGYSNDTGAV